VLPLKVGYLRTLHIHTTASSDRHDEHPKSALLAGRDRRRAVRGGGELCTFDALRFWPARVARDPGMRWLKEQILRITDSAAG
jgi:hypothetical protein